MNATKSNSLAAMGSWTMLGLLALLFGMTVMTGTNYSGILGNLGLLVSGGVELIPSGQDMTLIAKVGEIFAVILLQLPLVIIAAKLFNKSKSYNDAAMQAAIDKGPFLFFKIITFEEVLARGIFLVVLGYFLTGAVWFYILFFLGNTVWALIHLMNYKNPEDRKIMIVLPQFITGVAFTYILVRFGFGAAIMAHFLYDMVLLSGMKEKDTFEKNVINSIYFLVLGSFVFFIGRASGVGLSDLTPWLEGRMVKLDSFGFWGYVALMIMLRSLVGIIVNFLLFDSSEKKQATYDEVLSKTGFKVMAYIFGFALGVVAIILGLNWLIGIVGRIPGLSWVFGESFSDPFVRAVLITITLSLMQTTKSGSAMARVTLVNLPSVYFIVVAIAVLDFWSAVGLAAISYLINFFPDYIDSE
jgi:hypothetical protein